MNSLDGSKAYRKVLATALLAAAPLTAAANGQDAEAVQYVSPEEWELMPTDDLWAKLVWQYVDLGATAEEANRLATLLTEGIDIESEEFASPEQYCFVYTLRTYWCVNGNARINVNTVQDGCVSQGITPCPAMNCSPASPVFWGWTSTCYNGVPSGTCVFVEVSGPHRVRVHPNDPTCNGAEDCSCWGVVLSCAGQTCVLFENGRPAWCPSCLPPG